MARLKKTLPFCWKGRSKDSFLPFYGWVVVIGGGFIRLASSPGHTFGINMFVEEFISDNTLQIDRLGVSLVWLFASLFSAACVPFAGVILDRMGARKMLALVSIPYTLVIFSLSFAKSAVVLGILVCLTRFLGPECLTLIATVTANRWFEKKRGMASAALGLFGTLLRGQPIFVEPLIATFGWRQTYVYISFAIALCLGVGLCLIQDKPQVFGILPDGDLSSLAKEDETQVKLSTTNDKEDEKQGKPLGTTKETGATLRTALVTPVFWSVAGCQSMFGLFWSGMNYYIIDHFSLVANLNSEETAKAIFLPLTVSITLGRTIAGTCWIDCLSVTKRVRVMGMCVILLSLIMISSDHINSRWSASAWALIYGLLIGVKDGFYQVLLADIFGTKHVGKITGFATALGIGSTGIGPSLFAWSRQSTGSYSMITYTLAAAVLIQGCSMFVVAVSVLDQRKKSPLNTEMELVKETKIRVDDEEEVASLLKSQGPGQSGVEIS